MRLALFDRLDPRLFDSRLSSLEEGAREVGTVLEVQQEKMQSFEVQFATRSCITKVPRSRAPAPLRRQGLSTQSSPHFTLRHLATLHLTSRHLAPAPTSEKPRCTLLSISELVGALLLSEARAR